MIRNHSRHGSRFPISSASKPGAPTIGTATATGASSATVSFTQPASNGGSVITSYTATSSPGGITGVLLAVARIAGETAPLLFTALSNQFWTSSLGEPMASLPVTIFKFAMSPYENWQKLAWAGVLIITMAVLGLNILARVLTRSKS